MGFSELLMCSTIKCKLTPKLNASGIIDNFFQFFFLKMEMFRFLFQGEFSVYS